MSLSVLNHQQYTNALILCLWVYLATNNTQMPSSYVSECTYALIWVYLTTNNTQMPSSYVSDLTTNNTKMPHVLNHQQYTNALILCLWLYLTTNNTNALILCLSVYLTTNNTLMPSSYVSQCT